MLKRFLCQKAIGMCQVDGRWGWSLRTWNVLKTHQGASDNFAAGSPRPSSTRPQWSFHSCESREAALDLR